jgi:hypothetical protein
MHQLHMYVTEYRLMTLLRHAKMNNDGTSSPFHFVHLFTHSLRPVVIHSLIIH